MLHDFPHPLGSPGFSLPDLSQMDRLDICSNDDVLKAHELGLEVVLQPIPNQETNIRLTIFLDKRAEKRRLKITLSGKSSSALVVLGGRRGIVGSLLINGNGCRYIDMGCEHKASVGSIYLNTDNGIFYFGREATANQFSTTCTGQGNALFIGEDCMLATEVLLYATDFHAVFDLETGAVINENPSGPLRPIILEPHVWLGSRVMVMKGVRIGAGSAIGAGGVVTRSIPQNVVAAGNPAKVVRKNASWSRYLHPSTSQIEDVRKRLDEWNKARTEEEYSA